MWTNRYTSDELRQLPLNTVLSGRHCDDVKQDDTSDKHNEAATAAAADKGDVGDNDLADNKKDTPAQVNDTPLQVKTCVGN